MPKLLLHIGYAKAASSWLQKAVFPKVENINYLGRHKDDMDAKYLGFCSRLAVSSDFEINSAEQEYISSNLSASVFNVISHETILRPFSYELAIRRIGDIFSGLDIHYVVIIRRQAGIIFSRLNHDLKLEGFPIKKDQWSPEDMWTDKPASCRWPVCKLERFQNCECFRVGIKRTPRWYFDYYRTWTILRSLIPRDKLHFIPFESVVYPPYEGLKTMLAIANTGIDDASLETLASSPRVNESINNRNLDSLNAEIHAYYSESNRKLEQEARIPLSTYGYMDP